VVAAVVFAAVVPNASTAAELFTDGFESADLASWSGSSNLAVQSSVAHSGAWAARAVSSGSPSHAWRTFDPEPEVWSTVRFTIVSRSGPVWLTSMRKRAGGVILHIGVNASGRIVARNNVARTTVKSDVTVPSGAWHELEVRLAVGSGAGFDVWYDGDATPVLSRSANFGATNIGRIGIGDSSAGRVFDVAFDDVTVASDSGEPDLSPPSAPASLVAVPRDDAVAIELSWQASVDDLGVTAYHVSRSQDGVTFSPVTTVSGTSHLDVELAVGTTYWWIVEAVDAAGNRSPPSEPVSATTIATDPATTIGEWSAPFDLGVSGVHATLLFTGKVLLFQRTTTGVSTLAKLWDPTTGAVTDVSVPAGTDHNLYCSGHALRPNGDVIVTGGTLWGGSNPDGSDQTAFFDPIAETWRVGPPMDWRRWYPSDVTLPDGDLLVVSGTASQGVFAADMERYSDATGSFTTLPSSASLKMGYYPRLFVLPDGRVVRVGTERGAMYFDPASSTWTPGPSMSFGARTQGSAVMLDDGESVLAIGGATGFSSPTTATTELIDFGDAQPAWRASSPMAEPRRNLNVVPLPDGTVLAIGGNRDADLFSSPVFTPERFDPETETWTTMAAHVAPRAYHSTASLLPDGRVLVAGQTQGQMKTTAEVYSPPYLFAGPRPTIHEAPAQIGHGSSFVVSSSDAGEVERVVLIRAGTSTHGVSFDQRSLSLSFSADAGSGSLTVAGPASAAQTPPGWYMLFVVDGDGVPSVASWVQVT
jgi:hypothetical protein